MKKISKLMSVLLVIILISASCTKEGKEGLAGADGNANVIVKNITILPSEWEDNGYSVFVGKDVVEITDDIVYNGAVFVQLKANDFYQALPVTDLEGQVKVYNYTYGIGGIEFSISSDEAISTFNENVIYKVIIMEGNILTKAKNSGVDVNNLKEMAIFINLDLND